MTFLGMPDRDRRQCGRDRAAMSRRDLIRSATVGMAALALPRWAWGLAQAAGPRPNVVIILADDMGYGDLGCYGNKGIRTPHLDAMAAAGLRFTDFHSNAPICSPTRAALMTGRYQQRMGIDRIVTREANSPLGLPASETTFAQVLKSAGYATGLCGKWHLGFGEPYSPLARGFDEFRGFLGGQIDYHSHADPGGKADWWNGRQSLREKGYLTDLITAHAIDFIERHKAPSTPSTSSGQAGSGQAPSTPSTPSTSSGQASSGQAGSGQAAPFCLLVAHGAPHAPYQGPGDKAEADVGKPGTEFGPRQDRAAAYKEMVESLDAGVGRLLRALKDNKLEGDTFVFFASDNGQGEAGSPGPFHGRKGMLLEGGIRVPGIAYWPGTIRPGRTAQTAMTMDLLPTLASLAGAALPKGVAIDGTDLSPLLREGKALPARTLFWQHRGGQFAVRKGPWKLWNLGGKPRLYNLDDNPGETKDLAAAKPQLVKAMLDEHRAWLKQVSPR